MLESEHRETESLPAIGADLIRFRFLFRHKPTVSTSYSVLLVPANRTKKKARLYHCCSQRRFEISLRPLDNTMGLTKNPYYLGAANISHTMNRQYEVDMKYGTSLFGGHFADMGN